MHQCIKFILFWVDTLHVSDGLSVHHQERPSETCRVSFQNKINLLHWCIWLVIL